MPELFSRNVDDEVVYFSLDNFRRMHIENELLFTYVHFYTPCAFFAWLDDPQKYSHEKNLRMMDEIFFHNILAADDAK